MSTLADITSADWQLKLGPLFPAPPVNLFPDPMFERWKFAWSDFGLGVLAPGTAPDGSQGLVYTGTGSNTGIGGIGSPAPYTFSSVVSLVPGAVYTFVSQADLTALTAGRVTVDIFDAGASLFYGEPISINFGGTGPLVGTFQMPAEATEAQIAIQFYGCIAPAGQQGFVWGLGLFEGPVVQPADPSIGAVVQGLDDIDQCISIILTTPKGSDPLRPTFGAGILDILDQPLDIAIPQVVREVTDAITQWEPRVQLISVNVQPILDSTAQSGAKISVNTTWQLALTPSAPKITSVTF